MSPIELLPRMYEDLANHYARQGESRLRDNCLVLAAAAAHDGQLPAEAERLRKRLLLTNPNHLLRPYGSMAEALQSSDVRDVIADLRRQLPPQSVERMLNRPAGTYAVEGPAPQPVPKFKPMAAGAAPVTTPVPEPVTPLSYALSLLMFALGLLLAGAFLFITLATPRVN